MWKRPAVSLLDQVWIPIQFASVLQPSGPGKDARYGVGAGGFPLQTAGSDKLLYQHYSLWQTLMLHCIQNTYIVLSNIYSCTDGQLEP